MWLALLLQHFRRAFRLLHIHHTCGIRLTAIQRIKYSIVGPTRQRAIAIGVRGITADINRSRREPSLRDDFGNQQSSSAPTRQLA